MAVPWHFASTEKQFSRVLERVGAVVNVGASLPESPFTSLRAPVDFCQFEWLLGGGFEPVLHDLAMVHGDSSVSLIVLDPPASYFRRHHTLLPAFELSVESIAGGYWDALTHELGGGPGALAFISERVAVVGSSQQWAIWGQRDWDLVILITQSPDRPWQLHDVPFVDVREAVEEFVVPSLFSQPLSETDLAAFVESFSERWR